MRSCARWCVGLGAGLIAAMGVTRAGNEWGEGFAVDARPVEFVERAGQRAFSGRMIVKVHTDEALAHAVGADRVAMVADLGRRTLEPMTIRRLLAPETYLIAIPEGEDENALAARLMATGAYEYVEPDWILSPLATPNDANFANQWQHAVMQSELAWDIGTGHGAIVCASCDTGVDLDHPDLAAMLVPGVNTVGEPIAQVDGGEVDDVNGHGTFVGGLMAAIGNNGIGVAGCGWGFGLMPVRVSNLPSGNASLSDIIEGAVWASANGARIMNCSYTGVQSSSVQNAGATIKANGGLLFWAAGNDGENLTGFDHADVVVVGATTLSDTKASFSAYGPGVDVFAPGVGVWSTVIGGTYGPGGGTSYAAPIAAGVAALIWSIDPSLTPDEVQAILYAGCEDLGDPGDDDYWGHGRVNAYLSSQMVTPPAEGPGAFDRVAPVSGATNTGITVHFEWTASDEADWYVLEVDDDPSFASPAVDQTVFGTSWDAPFPLLSWGETYSWRVTAHNLLGSTPATSGVATFSTGAEPQPGGFALLHPAEGATDVQPFLTMTWGPSSDALEYRLLIVEQGGSFGDPLVERAIDWDLQSSIIYYGTLDWGTTYIWRVLASNGAGTTVSSPATGSFTTAPAPVPGAFSLLTPVNFATNIPTGPTFSWSYAQSATSYWLEIGLSPTSWR